MVSSFDFLETPFYKQLGFKSYQSYLNSPLWIKKHKQYDKANLPRKCRICGTPTKRLHHRTYATLGKEDIKKDIVPICTLHHEAIHFENGERLPLLPNVLIGREEMLYREHRSIWRWLGDIRLGSLLNKIFTLG